MVLLIANCRAIVKQFVINAKHIIYQTYEQNYSFLINIYLLINILCGTSQILSFRKLH